MENNSLGLYAPRVTTLLRWGFLVVICLLMMLPIMVVLSSWLKPLDPIWGHLRQYVLPEVLSNTVSLLLIVGTGSSIIGVGLAWLTSMCQFPGRRFFSWALMLPLAIPAYVFAFVALGFFEYSGVFQTTLRGLGIEVGVPSLRNTWGAGVVLSFAFYPYVYLLARSAFLTQGQRLIEAGQMLGLSRWQAFFRLALPSSLPWIIGGLLIAMMETLADFGAVSIFNVDTFTTAIYKAWFGLFNLTAAAQLAGLLILFVLLILLAEQYWRQRRQFASTAGRYSLIRLSSAARWSAVVICTLVLTLAVILPIGQLAYWTSTVIDTDLDSRYFGFVWHTVQIASLTSMLIALIAVLMAWFKRQLHSQRANTLVALSNLGYAVPGTVLAVGVYLPIAWLDNRMIEWGWVSLPILSGSVAIMLIALSTRFLTVAFQPIERQLGRLKQHQQDAARLLTTSRWQRWQQVYLPVMRSGVLSAMLFGFVEVIKEMPITLMTRRNGWDTLAVRVFEMTSEGMWARAALPSLLIVAVGIIPVWLLIRQTEKL